MIVLGSNWCFVEGQFAAEAEPERQAPTLRDAEARADARASELGADSGDIGGH